MGGAFQNMLRRHAAASAGSNVGSYINADGSVKETRKQKSERKAEAAKPKPTGNWRDDAPTTKQLQAIINMSTALHWNIESPKTKGEACDAIDKMSKEIQTRLSATGYIRPTNDWQGFGDDGLDNESFHGGG